MRSRVGESSIGSEVTDSELARLRQECATGIECGRIRTIRPVPLARETRQALSDLLFVLRGIEDQHRAANTLRHFNALLLSQYTNHGENDDQ